MEPKWLTQALKDKGLCEIKGEQDNPRIVEMFTHTSYHAQDDETSWCSAGACTWLEECGLKSPHSAAAISFEKYGQKLDHLCVGALVVIKRKGATNKDARHITICTNPDYSLTMFTGFGGNQHDMADYSHYKKEDITAIRWPEGEALP